MTTAHAISKDEPSVSCDKFRFRTERGGHKLDWSDVMESRDIERLTNSGDESLSTMVTTVLLL